MMIRSAKSGSDQNTSALITAVESGPLSMSTFANNNYSYMRFRTPFGGVEIVSVSIGAAPRITRRQPGHFQSESMPIQSSLESEF